ncbi:MAG TPA: response regulator transcription factor [Candidatus Krumholzibacteria bacterium]|jgi:DNA-binding NarL/FixJ family response regulator|nr:response regulator transcription factor [Candidatus Krumholzibacteria bacterium]
MSLRVLVAEDHQLVSDGIVALLRAAGHEIVGRASDGQTAVRLAETLHPDIAVLDASMPLLNGIDASRAIQRVRPDTKAIIVTVHDEDEYVLNAFRAGVRGYVLKKQAAADLLQAIKEVQAGSVYVSPGMSRALVDAVRTNTEMRSDLLTGREREVLQLVAEGKTSKEIASVLDVSVKTAETHRANIMNKLDIHETAGLVRYAIRHGMVEA